MFWEPIIDLPEKRLWFVNKELRNKVALRESDYLLRTKLYTQFNRKMSRQKNAYTLFPSGYVTK